MSNERTVPLSTTRAARNAPPNGEELITVQRVVQLARKHAVLLIACWAAVFAATFFWTLGEKRIYHAESVLRFDPDPPRPLGQRVEMLSSNDSNIWGRHEFYESEFRVIKSMRVAMATVRTLGLNADPAFFQLSPKLAATFRPRSVEDTARVLVARTTVESVKDSSLAIVRYEDTDPHRSQLIVNTLVRTYLAQNLENTATVSTSALEWLNTQLEHLKVDLEKSETALNDYRQKNNVLSISLEDQHNIIAAQLEQLSQAQTGLEIKRTEIAAREAELRSIQPETGSVAATELLQNLVLGTLRTSYAEQSRSLEELTATLGDAHPRVMSARAKLESLRLSIQHEIENVKEAVRRDLRAVEHQIADLKKKDDEAQTHAHELQSLELTYNQLNRTRVNNEKIYTIVLERARETDLTRMLNFNNIRVVDEALEPKAPVRPNVPVNLSIGALVGLLLGAATAAVREMTDRSIKTPADVETGVGVACLGLVPKIDAGRRRRHHTAPVTLAQRDLIVAQQPDSGVAEALRAIRTNLAFMATDRAFSAILLTSALPEEGKSTVACSLAIVLAQSGHRVLLVDTDLRRPRLHRSFGISNDVGVTMLLSGQAGLEECVRTTEVSNLSILTSGPIPPNPAEMLESKRFLDLVAELREKFDRVVFDSPPVLPVTDAVILSKVVDGVMLVVRGNHTPTTAVRRATRSLLDVNANLLGIALNAVDLSRHEYREYHYYYKRNAYYSLSAAEVAERGVRPTDDVAPKHVSH